MISEFKKLSFRGFSEVKEAMVMRKEISKKQTIIML
jgi:hypothetical protein